MAQPHEIEAAYYHGLNEMRGIDSEVAEDLGIPTSPESYDRHVSSAVEAVGMLATAHAEGETSPVQTELSDRATGIINALADINYRSNLPTGSDLFHLIRVGELTQAESEVVREAVKKRRAELTAPGGELPGSW